MPTAASSLRQRGAAWVLREDRPRALLPRAAKVGPQAVPILLSSSFAACPPLRVGYCDAHIRTPTFTPLLGWRCRAHARGPLSDRAYGRSLRPEDRRQEPPRTT